MKQKVFLILATALAAACNSGRQPAAVAETPASSDDADNEPTAIVADTPAQREYDPTDAQSFGLSGNVLLVASQVYSTRDNAEGELEETDLEYTTTIKFNEWGHVVQDEWENEYGYDADGNYYRGNHTYTKVVRDNAGRIVQYIDEEPDKDNDSNKKLTLSYDKAGRLTLISQGGWTGQWEEKREYADEKPYPTKASISATYEGGGASKRVMEYRYSNFDSHGNWQTRIITYSATVTEMDDEGMDIESTKSGIWIEKRIINYYY